MIDSTNEAQRELCLRGANCVHPWCVSPIHSSSRNNHKGPGSALAIGLPQRTCRTLHMCVNLNELTVLFQERRPGLQEPKYLSSVHMLNDLTMAISLKPRPIQFLRCQHLDPLKLHSGKMAVFNSTLAL